MGFEDLTVKGYKIAQLSFSAVVPILGNEGLDTGTLNGLQLRDHGLAGGEIHIDLTPDNRISADPGYWYAIKCEHDQASGEEVVGTIYIKRMIGQDCVDEMEAPLDELDRSHFIDRVSGEILDWHAQKCGNGPHPDWPERPKLKP